MVREIWWGIITEPHCTKWRNGKTLLLCFFQHKISHILLLQLPNNTLIWLTFVSDYPVVQILKSFTQPVTCSICIPSRSIRRDVSTSYTVSCFLPLVLCTLEDVVCSMMQDAFLIHSSTLHEYVYPNVPRLTYFSASSLKDIFECIDNQNIKTSLVLSKMLIFIINCSIC